MNQSRTVRLPVHILKKISGCLRTVKKLSEYSKHSPTINEIAHELDKPFEEIEKMLLLLEGTVSIDAPINDSDHPLSDLLSDKKINDPADYLQEYSFREKIDEVLSFLSDNHKEVILRRFGLLGYEPETLEQVGENMGITRERVRQIQVDALRKLKLFMERDGLDSKTLFQ